MNYELDNIYCADCYEAIKNIPDKSIDLIYTDIPYMQVMNGSGNTLLCKRARNKKAELSKISDGIDYAIFDDFVRVLKKINVFIWCSRVQIFEIMKIFVEKYHCSYEILTWNKTNPTPTTNGHWLPDIEYCLYFREDGVKLNDGYDLKSKWYTSGANKSDKDKFHHPTIKPLPLVQRHIQHTVQGGGTILDPFAGSGTTLVAAKNLGLHYIGFEVDERWFQICKDRLNGIDASGQMSLFLR